MKECIEVQGWKKNLMQNLSTFVFKANYFTN